MLFSRNVLIVDDEAPFAENLAVSLREYGYGVYTVTTGDLAIEFIRDGKAADLILVNVDGGPGMDGFAAAEAIIRERDVPVIFLSNNTGGPPVEKAANATACGYVLKNSGYAVIEASVRMALRQHEARVKAGASAEMYRTVADFTHDWEFWIDPEGAFRYVSPSCEDISGYPPPAFTDDPSFFFSIVHPEDRKILEDHCRDVLDRGLTTEKHSLDFRIIHRNGLVVWIGHRCAPVYGPGGISLGVRGSNRDITDRKSAEDGLHEAHRHLEALWSIANLRDLDIRAVCDHTLETVVAMTGSAYGFYGFINDDESVMTIFSWSGNAMKDCAIVDSPSDFTIADAGIWAEAVRSRKPLILNEYTAVHPAKKGFPEGHVPLTRLMVVPVFNGPRIVALAAVADREREYGEEDLRQVASFLDGIQTVIEHKNVMIKLESSEMEKTQLLRELRHRIKNNFNMISSIISLETRRASAQETKEALKALNGRISSVAELYSLLQGSDREMAVRLDEYFEHILSSITSLFQSASPGIVIRRDLAPLKSENGPAANLGLVLNELVTNSLKYGFPEGRPGFIDVSLRADGKDLLLAVSDDGVGLPPGFEGSSSRGLGLTIIGTIVRQMGGEFTFMNGERTTFTVRVPVQA